MKVEDRV